MTPIFFFKLVIILETISTYQPRNLNVPLQYVSSKVHQGKGKDLSKTSRMVSSGQSFLRQYC